MNINILKNNNLTYFQISKNTNFFSYLYNEDNNSKANNLKEQSNLLCFEIWNIPKLVTIIKIL